jgi:hypothetical protein
MKCDKIYSRSILLLICIVLLICGTCATAGTISSNDVSYQASSQVEGTGSTTGVDQYAIGGHEQESYRAAGAKIDGKGTATTDFSSAPDATGPYGTTTTTGDVSATAKSTSTNGHAVANASIDAYIDASGHYYNAGAEILSNAYAENGGTSGYAVADAIADGTAYAYVPDAAHTYQAAADASGISASHAKVTSKLGEADTNSWIKSWASFLDDSPDSVRTGTEIGSEATLWYGAGEASSATTEAAAWSHAYSPNNNVTATSTSYGSSSSSVKGNTGAEGGIETIGYVETWSGVIDWSSNNPEIYGYTEVNANNEESSFNAQGTSTATSTYSHANVRDINSATSTDLVAYNLFMSSSMKQKGVDDEYIPEMVDNAPLIYTAASSEFDFMVNPYRDNLMFGYLWAGSGAVGGSSSFNAESNSVATLGYATGLDVAIIDDTPQIRQIGMQNLDIETAASAKGYGIAGADGYIRADVSDYYADEDITQAGMVSRAFTFSEFDKSSNTASAFSSTSGGIQGTFDFSNGSTGNSLIRGGSVSGHTNSQSNIKGNTLAYSINELGTGSFAEGYTGEIDKGFNLYGESGNAEYGANRMYSMSYVGNYDAGDDEFMSGSNGAAGGSVGGTSTYWFKDVRNSTYYLTMDSIDCASTIYGGSDSSVSLTKGEGFAESGMKGKIYDGIDLDWDENYVNNFIWSASEGTTTNKATIETEAYGTVEASDVYLSNPYDGSVWIPDMGSKYIAISGETWNTQTLQKDKSTPGTGWGMSEIEAWSETPSDYQVSVGAEYESRVSSSGKSISDTGAEVYGIKTVSERDGYVEYGFEFMTPILAQIDVINHEATTLISPKTSKYAVTLTPTPNLFIVYGENKIIEPESEKEVHTYPMGMSAEAEWNGFAQADAVIF